MRKFTIPIAIVAGLIAPAALAADIAVKAPPAPAPAPVYNWTGWYVGVNAGASFGRAKTDFNNNGPFTVTNASIPATATFSIPPVFSDTQSPSGFMGGGQIGYNWQVSPLWVVGLEADFQGALEKDNVILANNFTSTAVLSGAITGTRTVTGTAVEDFSTKIEWFGTARVRAGYVWGNGDVMSYLTGGLAYGKVDLEGTSTVTTNLSDVATILRQGVVARNFSHNDVNIGWVVGYGTEGRLALTNWTWKIERAFGWTLARSTPQASLRVSLVQVMDLS
jgi:outer membrane immunogenic protein